LEEVGNFGGGLEILARGRREDSSIFAYQFSRGFQESSTIIRDPTRQSKVRAHRDRFLESHAHFDRHAVSLSGQNGLRHDLVEQSRDQAAVENALIALVLVLGGILADGMILVVIERDSQPVGVLIPADETPAVLDDLFHLATIASGGFGIKGRGDRYQSAKNAPRK
jgi:hypothetical protein